MDPSRTPPSSEADDDIIELTDIVEKGAVPAASGDAGAGDNPLESQMADLLAETGKGPVSGEDAFDLDSLLKASGLNDGGELAEAKTAGVSSDAASAEVAGREAPSDEESDMPDMGEVDALLRDLVAPEQPEVPASDSVPDAASASTTDFEAVLQASAERENTVQDTDESGAAAEPEVDVDDLDSLLDSIMNPGTVTTVPSEAGASDMEETAEIADLDALLNAAQADDAHAKLSVTSSEAAESALKTAAPAPEAPVLSPVSAVEAELPEISSDVEPPAVDMEDDFDLDALLGAARAEMTDESAAPAATEAPLPGSGSDAGTEAEAGEDPLSGLDDLFAATESEETATGADLPLASDLDDPLLVGEAERPEPDLSALVLSSLDALAADIAAMQEKINEVADGNGGPDSSAFDAVRERVDDLTAEVRDLAERHADGLAAAEARISALEAELAAQGARTVTPLELPPEGSAFRTELAALIREVVVRELQEGEHVPPYAESMSEDMARLEERVDAMEASGEKAAAEAAARVIREEIAALLAETGPES
ncbi:MAG: hypothetical protein KHZ29_07450 [Desulfovibrionaceae bacterium]|nr:hypothetical protein [Desulfovibrionaceae bacterium]